MNILVTGGLGFIGSHFIEELFENVNINLLINIDNQTYAANKNLNFKNIYSTRYIEYNLDINDCNILKVLNEYEITYIVHFAAESHVDNSINSSKIFISTNINGTHNLLECSRLYGKINKFIHVSTDEVFGSLNFDEPSFTINNPYKPNSPYAASKASSDLLVRSYRQTYKMPTIITNCSNNFGPRQFPEKLIPLTLKKLINNEQIPIYGDGKNIRDWIYVKDHAKIISNILINDNYQDQYLIGGDNEISNINLINLIVDRYKELTGKPIRNDYIKFVEDRKGHDLRYSINNSNLNKNFPNFKFTNFKYALDQTIKSYL